MYARSELGTAASECDYAVLAKKTLRTIRPNHNRALAIQLSRDGSRRRSWAMSNYVEMLIQVEECRSVAQE